ncbi:ubiquitin fusion degradation protein [Coemansia guatemalensis]|uniref:Ubiquitin fusion degradation protein n=1 Tax=Coemansia guatemalensis TaxID=2761395 RepID=A0A9W8I5Y3_9FUNG|nr:ubiquitin fusion degradation protein [Coemansia guatemalensis]
MDPDDSGNDFGASGFGAFGPPHSFAESAFGAFAPPQPFGNHYTGRLRQFSRFYSAYPVAAHPGNKMDANYGGKIFLPPSALEEISQLEVVYPLMFRIKSDEDEGETGSKRRTHGGVLEFTAEEGRVYLPQWMMDTLHLQPTASVEVTNVALLQGALTKLQAQSTDFLDISDHRAVLERALRKFSALTVGDIISIEYNSHEYKLAVLETQPSPSAINIVETDLNVDFAPPVGYVEPARVGAGSQASNSTSLGDLSRPSSSIAKDVRQKEEVAKDEAASLRFQAFRGSGSRIGAKDNARPSSLRSYASASVEGEKQQDAADEDQKPVPLELPIGTLFFGYDIVPPPGSEQVNADAENDKKDGFQGEGRVLRQRRKR